MESGIKCAQPETLAFKPAVFEQVEKGELTYTDAQRRYGIQDSSTVLRELREHDRQNCSMGATARNRATHTWKSRQTATHARAANPGTGAAIGHANDKARRVEAAIDIQE
jgi:transposase